MSETIIGVDVSKDTLDAHRLPDGTCRRFANDRRGFAAFLGWLGAVAPERVVFEATGAYHRAFEQALAGAGLPGCKVNPRKAKHFGKAIGRLAKTDKADAAMLALMGAALKPDIRPAPSHIQLQLKDLQVARLGLVRDRNALKARAKQLHTPLLKRHAAQRLRQVVRQMKEVEAALKDLIASDPDLVRRFEILTSIPGLGPCAAFALVAEMPELGHLDAKTVAALSGTAPVTRQSGKWTGRSFVHGGRSQVRKALYMPALVAVRHNPDLKLTYERLRAAGKPPKVAITAVMRKLAILANTLIRANRTWTPKTA